MSDNRRLVNGEDRRKGDRRKAQQPFDGPDRRKGERRSGLDRRGSYRETDARLYVDDGAADTAAHCINPSSYAERRRAPRRPVRTTIDICDARGLRIEGEVTDLSLTGCKVALNMGLGLKEGKTYSFKLAGLVFDVGNVVWSAPGTAGLEFQQPIYSPVLEDIVRRFPPALSATSSGWLENLPPFPLLD
ncbi:MAG: PilZ domain-containing protein [Pseudomonadota bacterium]